MAPVGNRDLLARVRGRLMPEGLHIALPLGRAAFDDACTPSAGPRLGDLMRTSAGAIVIGDGGPQFFSRFRASAAVAGRHDDPLDDYTRTVMESAVADLFGPAASGRAVRLFYPFVSARPGLPFQRLGVAAGLPPPGPLGIQIHPVYGPWWAYRALLIVPDVLVEDGPVVASCPDCERPCVTACPGHAVLPSRFVPEDCMAHRLSDVSCRSSCIARIRCPVGARERYPEQQLAFHMDASLGT